MFRHFAACSISQYNISHTCYFFFPCGHLIRYDRTEHKHNTTHTRTHIYIYSIFFFFTFFLLLSCVFFHFFTFSSRGTKISIPYFDIDTLHLSFFLSFFLRHAAYTLYTCNFFPPPLLLWIAHVFYLSICIQSITGSLTTQKRIKKKEKKKSG